jgi:hypothetical protein
MPASTDPAVWKGASGWSASHASGAAIAVCSLAGLAAAGLGASSAVVATMGGVLPGALLLAAGYQGTIAALSRSGRPLARSARERGREFNGSVS